MLTAQSQNNCFKIDDTDISMTPLEIKFQETKWSKSINARSGCKVPQ